jgi:hypothetical protein
VSQLEVRLLRLLRLLRLRLPFGVIDPVFAELTERVHMETAERKFARSDINQAVSRLRFIAPARGDGPDSRN